MIKFTESFFREIYFESIIISIFYNFNQRFVEQNEEEILFKFKTGLDNVNKGTNNGRKITCRGILMGEHEYKNDDYLIAKNLREVLIIRRLIDYNFNLLKTSNENAIQEDELLWCITDFLCGRDAFNKKVLPEFNERSKTGGIKTDLHSYILNVCDDLVYYNKDSNKGAGGYVSNQNREKKYKLVEKVYKLICDKRSKEEVPNLD